jgi:N utilization substance protein B
MKERREARRIALDVLYEAEIREQLPSETWLTYEAHGRMEDVGGDEKVARELPLSHEAVDYAHSLVEGVQAKQSDIDSLIVRYADHWKIDRMPVIDRTLLRIALFEIFWGKDIPVAVAINEAVELAKSLSTEDSGRFINGLLGRIAERSDVGKGTSRPA